MCSSLCFGSSPHWSLNDVASGWNARSLVQSYFHNSELQRQWAWELLGKQGWRGDETVLDFGCGDGKISAEMCRLTSRGSVTGVDISSEMFHFAEIKFPSYAYSNLEFQKSNSLVFDDFVGSYDVITSFCVLHQVGQPLEVLKNLKKHLKTEGRLVCVVPAGKNPAFFAAANEIFSKYELEAPWAKALVGAGPTMRTIEGCRELLELAGYKEISLEMIDIDNPFYDKAELIAWMVGNTTANWSIPLSLSEAFFTDLVERMCELDLEIIDAAGRLHFKLSRIHVVASA